MNFKDIDFIDYVDFKYFINHKDSIIFYWIYIFYKYSIDYIYLCRILSFKSEIDFGINSIFFIKLYFKFKIIYIYIEYYKFCRLCIVVYNV